MWRSSFVCPSIVTLDDVREVEGTLIFISTCAGRIMGLNERECGAIGVTHITWALWWTIEPPHERLYAVLPVGVEMSTPSPYTTVRRTLLMYISICAIASLFLMIVTSLRDWNSNYLSDTGSTVMFSGCRFNVKCNLILRSIQILSYEALFTTVASSTFLYSFISKLPR